MSIEPIPTGYIIVEPGRTVGWLSNANLIPRNRPEIAAATALASEYMGARLIVTDSGSGAESPVSPEFIKAVKSVLSVPYFYAGGCRTPEQAYEIVKAGADGIQIGTAFELEGDGEKLFERVSAIRKAIKDAGKERKKGRLMEMIHNIERPQLPVVRVPRWFKVPTIRKPRIDFDAIRERVEERFHKDDKKPQEINRSPVTSPAKVSTKAKKKTNP